LTVANISGWDPRDGFGAWDYFQTGPGAAEKNRANPYADLVGQAQGLYSSYYGAGARGMMPNYRQYQAPRWENPAVWASANDWRQKLQQSQQGLGAGLAKDMANARANVRGGLRVGGGSDPYAEYLKGAIGSIAGQSADLLREGYGNLVANNKWNYGLARDRYGDWRSMMSDRLGAFNTLSSAMQQQEAWNQYKNSLLQGAWNQQGDQNVAAKNYARSYVDWLQQQDALQRSLYQQQNQQQNINRAAVYGQNTPGGQNELMMEALNRLLLDPAYMGGNRGGNPYIPSGGASTARGPMNLNYASFQM